MRRKLNLPTKLSTLLFITALSTGFALWSPALSETASKSQDVDLRITILHTNDVHAHDESFFEKGHETGGLARIGHLIRSLRPKVENPIVIDAGDIFQGTPMFTRYKGQTEVDLYNMIGYDIYTIGNHEFDEGAKNLAEKLSKAKFQIVCCNMDASAVPELAKLIKPSVVREVKGEKIGFVGAMTPDLPKMSFGLEGVKIIKGEGDDWIKPIADEVAKLKAQGINKIILVTHCGVDADKELAAAIPDVDAIIGGHSHTRLDEAVKVKRPDGTEVMIVQTGCYGRALGEFKLAFDRGGKLLVPESHYELINTAADVSQDEDLKAFVDEKVKPLLALRNEIVGVAETDFENRFRGNTSDSPIGDLIADSIAEAGEKYGVQVAFENRGGIRGPIEKGKISEEKVQEVLPFYNRVVCATVSGERLLKTLEHSVNAGASGHYLDEHGLQIGFDLSKQPGERVVFAYLVAPDGTLSPIDKKSKYKMAMTDFSFKGGEGYEFADAENVETTDIKINAALHNYLMRHKNVTSQAPSRQVELTNGILGLQKKESDSDGNKVFAVKNVGPDSKVTVYEGDSQGVTKLSGWTPAPVAHAKEVKSVSANDKGEVTFTVPAGKGKKFVAILAKPKVEDKEHRTLISYPIEIE